MFPYSLPYKIHHNSVDQINFARAILPTKNEIEKYPIIPNPSSFIQHLQNPRFIQNSLQLHMEKNIQHVAVSICFHQNLSTKKLAPGPWSSLDDSDQTGGGNSGNSCVHHTKLGGEWKVIKYSYQQSTSDIRILDQCSLYYQSNKNAVLRGNISKLPCAASLIIEPLNIWVN